MTSAVWITRVPDPGPGPRLAVKDNLDVAGLPTTCAHPAFGGGAPAARTATAVQRLLDAGAVVVGKTNLDQFATGLVGTRSPYGAVRNPHQPSRLAGGSSSGSAAAVALGEADLAVGTDTAGSGRVPAALCGVVGIKPTLGLVPSDGVVPAVPSLDCVSIFAPTVGGAAGALARMAGGARPVPVGTPVAPAGPLRIGVPALVPGLDQPAAVAWEQALKELAGLGAVIEVDATPYLAAGRLVYSPAFLPERHVSFGAFLASHPEGADPQVAAIARRGGTVSGSASAQERSRLPALVQAAATWWDGVDVVCVPTVGEAPSLEDVAAAPAEVNRRLGAWTAGANPLDLCAAAVPCGWRDDGVPFGVTFLGPAFADPVVAVAAARLAGEPDPPPPAWAGWVDVVVVGAHLAGQPLNGQLTSRGASLVREARTAPEYRLVALDTDPPKPGLVRAGSGGAAIEVEVWRLPADRFGPFAAAIPPPLGIGTVVLEDGTSALGYLCEAWAAADAADISRFGGWRAYLRSQ